MDHKVKVIDGAPIVCSYEDVQKVMDAMWLLQVQTFAVIAEEKEGSHNNINAQFLRKRLDEEKVSNSGIGEFIRIHLPCQYFNPHKHKVILK